MCFEDQHSLEKCHWKGNGECTYRIATCLVASMNYVTVKKYSSQNLKQVEIHSGKNSVYED